MATDLGAVDADGRRRRIDQVSETRSGVQHQRSVPTCVNHQSNICAGDKGKVEDAEDDSKSGSEEEDEDDEKTSVVAKPSLALTVRIVKKQERSKPAFQGIVEQKLPPSGQVAPFVGVRKRPVGRPSKQDIGAKRKVGRPPKAKV